MPCCIVPRQDPAAPLSLFRQCLNLVASNLSFVESLEGFPQDVGVQIWDTALLLGQLDEDDNETATAIRLFGAAYPADFLPDLKLTSLVLINNYELSLHACLLRIARLDLSDLQLDDGHDLLSVIPDLTGLRVLILMNVPIDDRGLRRIFLPCLDGRKLPHLAHMDMSGTAYSLKSLAYLRRLPQLGEVLFYAEEKHLPQETIKAALAPAFRLAPRPSVQAVTTFGFGRGLFDRWEEVLAARKRRQETAAVLRPAFYGPARMEGTTAGEVGPTARSLRQLANKVMFCRTNKRAAGHPAEPGKESARKKGRYDLPQEIEEDSAQILNLYL